MTGDVEGLNKGAPAHCRQVGVSRPLIASADYSLLSWHSLGSVDCIEGKDPDPSRCFGPTSGRSCLMDSLRDSFQGEGPNGSLGEAASEQVTGPRRAVPALEEAPTLPPSRDALSSPRPRPGVAGLPGMRPHLGRLSDARLRWWPCRGAPACRVSELRKRSTCCIGFMSLLTRASGEP